MKPVVVESDTVVHPHEVAELIGVPDIQQTVLPEKRLIADNQTAAVHLGQLHEMGHGEELQLPGCHEPQREIGVMPLLERNPTILQSRLQKLSGRANPVARRARRVEIPV